MDLATVQRAYQRYANYYDRLFGAVLHHGRQVVIDKMNCRSGDRILEVGVGTGLSLPMYPQDCHIFGIDVSAEMLAQAQARVTRHGLHQVAGLACMDGEQLAFADNSFDKVVAMYVVSVVPNPVRLIDEMRRVCRPGGELYIVNHFLSDHPLLALAERALAPLKHYLGFRTDLSLAELIEQTRLDVVERVGVNAFGFWTLVRAHNNKPEVAQMPSLLPVQQPCEVPAGY